MAKFGEGDKRWIVEDRPDGTNVHNWHWVERDCFEWSRSLLSSLLSNLTILDDEGGLAIRTKTVDRVDGEAYVNVRKGKIIPGYELSLSLSWEGEARDSADGPSLLKVSGSLEVPYLADENAGEDPEVKITVRDDDGPVGRRIKDIFIAKGKPLVLEKIRAYVQAMATGGPVKDEIEVKKAPSDAGKAPAAGRKAFPAAPASGNAAAAAKKENKVKEGFRTITLTEKFNCRACDLYEILMDENRWKGFTQSNARISKEVGGQFSLFDGSITGVNEELQDGKLIVQKWRSGSWAEGIHSTVRLIFDEPEQGVTIVKLTQTEVPEEDKYGNATVVENTERGWRQLIFNKIRALFGFGI
ncbi:activator of 90 kDa heat shock protein ATPase homolog [Phoenix dactylifera]|uniref:Activator of 90 kDa heat shock protein ATPase homolog n=1 Tax=Phoenix dactylifera TaxID=42345 RepID=A0A8B9APA0_PHODC|nr:activator of 90 kDa heat shock protein ATPase homolog [Phoenix dactylifera]